jgi:hypothetical protein
MEEKIEMKRPDMVLLIDETRRYFTDQRRKLNNQPSSRPSMPL